MDSTMDEKHVALLRRNRETFAKSVAVERLFPMLNEIITLAETTEIKLLPSSEARVLRLLEILPGKGKNAFTYLCLALEKTYPHLLTVMCIGRDRETTGSSRSTVSTSESDLEEHGPRMMIPPPPMNRNIPASVGRRPGETGASKQSSLDSDIDEPYRISKRMSMPSDRSLERSDRGIPHRDYETLQENCHKAMLKLEKLTKECDQARKEADYYCKQYQAATSNGDQLRNELQTLQQEYRQLMAERNQVQLEMNDIRQMHDNDIKELNDLRAQSREVVGMMGQPDVKRMYDKAMDRYETLKRDYDALQKLYAELKGTHGTSMNKMDRLQEDMQHQIDSLRSDRESILKDYDLLRQQYASTKREFDKCRREHDEFRQQRFKALHDVKLLKKAQEERDLAVREHRLVMSERAEVLKENEKVQDEVQMEITKRKKAEERLNSLQAENSRLHQKLHETGQSHDQAVKQISEYSERYRELINNTMMAKKERERILQELQKYEQQVAVARRERKQALDQLEEKVQENYKAMQQQEMTHNECKEVSKEVEALRRTVDTLQRDYKEAVKQKEDAKILRDRAFSERNKIVQERESIRTLCDKLRRERDRAVSDYAEALRKTDDVERKKNEVTKELNQVMQNVMQQEEEGARMRQLIAHSRDSAIDADSQEWQMERVELGTVMDDGDMSMLGFDMGNCNKDHQFPDDCSVVVTKVDKGSVADGRLRVNDCVVRVNDVDLTNGGDCNIAAQAVKNSRGVLNMVVKRRRPSGIRHHPVKLFYGGKEHGLVLDTGIFISRIVPGSAAASEGSLLPGDRILYVDGNLVEDKSVPEVEKMLTSSCESVMLSIIRITGMPTSSSTSPTVESIKSQETSSSKSSLTTPMFPLPMEMLGQTADQNGNPHPSSKHTSAQTEKMQSAQREDYLQHQGSGHSRESSRESCSAVSGEHTPVALSRQNSVREPIHMHDTNRETRGVNGTEYSQNSLKREDSQHRSSRRSYVVHDNQELSVKSPHQPRKSNSQYEYEHKMLSVMNAKPLPQRRSFHSHDTMNERQAFDDVYPGAKSSHGNDASRVSLSREDAHRLSMHSSDGGSDAYPLTNGDTHGHSQRDVPLSIEDFQNLPSGQFTRNDPRRESLRSRDVMRGMNPRHPGHVYRMGPQNRPPYSSPMPHQGQSNKSSQSNWDECNNRSVPSVALKAPNHVNGNVQQVRPRSQDFSYREAHPSSPHGPHRSFDSSSQQQKSPHHYRSLSNSSGRDWHSAKPHCNTDFSGEWDANCDTNDNLLQDFSDNKTVPTKSQKHSSPFPDHSTWPTRVPPDALKEGHKRRKRNPLPNKDSWPDSPFVDEPEIAKPKPPERVSSFKASQRHHPSLSESSSGSECRWQSPPSTGTGIRTQGSHVSLPAQSTTVTVTPLSPLMNSQSSIPDTSNMTEGATSMESGFPDYSRRDRNSKHLSITNVEFHNAIAPAFKPVSVPAVPPVNNTLSGESAIVPTKEGQLQASLPATLFPRRAQDSLQTFHATPVNTVPPFPMPGGSEPSTPSMINGWQYSWFQQSKPTPAQIIVQPNNIVPSYISSSYKLSRVSPDHLNFPVQHIYPEKAPSQTSLPEYRPQHQSSSLSTNSDLHLDAYPIPHRSSGYMSLPNKFDRIRLPGYPCRPSPGPSSSSDITSLSNSGNSSPTSSSLQDDSQYQSSGSLEPIITIGPPNRGRNDPRHIVIEKTVETLETLGFTIKEGPRGGIFVNTVTENSLAARSGLQYGDQILEFNGINLRRATYDLAVQILTRPGNSISIMAQYNRNKIGDRQRDSMCSSTQSTPIASQTSTRTNSPTPTITPPTPRASRTQSMLSADSYLEAGKPRFVFLKKSGASLGLRIYGGNAVGIFVSEIGDISIANKPDGLRVGDQILEYNGVNLRNATAEQATMELQKPAEEISILVQYNIGEFNRIQSRHPDKLFIKALIDNPSEKEGHFSFKRDDIMMVDDTMYKGVMGTYNVWLIDQEGHKKKCCQIPSKSAMQREMMTRRLRSESNQEEELKYGRISGSARRSFLKRKKPKHQHNNSKDSRELSEGSMSNVPILEETIMTYQRVERLDMHIKRPVILLGPLVEKVSLKIMDESPNLYTRVHSKMDQSPHQLLEKDIESGLIVDFQRKENMFEVIYTATIKDICKKGCHCMMDNVNPAVAERLKSLQLHPIVIFVKFKSLKSIKEQKDPHFLRERVTHKQAKEMFEMASKIEQEYKSIFTEIIHGGNLASISNHVKKTIDIEQRRPIWIPSSQML
ncbi:disks large homolog 5-like [Diadema setosum]|uniref:disks large homolog 5-like n=1 Tax=Diadema setosum TaxID=31175 RepID=UPI003B3B774D